MLAQYLEAPEASHATSTKSNSNSNADSDVDGGAPAALSHLNGEGVLLAMALGPSFVEEKFVHVSPPTLYADSSQLGTVSYTYVVKNLGSAIHHHTRSYPTFHPRLAIHHPPPVTVREPNHHPYPTPLSASPREATRAPSLRSR